MLRRYLNDKNISIDDILNYIKKNTRTIFIDEGNFLKGDVGILTDLSIDKNIDIYVCGLNMTSEQKPFGIMPSILSVSDEIEICKGYCTECNRPASYTYFEGGKNKDIVVCASDLMAIGAMKALIQMDIFRPVCGFDGIILMGYVGKQMNTVRQDFASISESAMEELQELMNGGYGRNIVMKHSLVRMKYEDIIA